MAHTIDPVIAKSLLNYDPETGGVTWKIPGPARRLGVPLGTRTSRGYLRISIEKRAVFLHRLIWVIMTGEQPSEYIDHINGDKTDNRWCNLREATHAENGWNAKISARNTSGIKGLGYNRSNGLWRAQISGKSKHFKSKEAATLYVNQQREIQHKQFMRY